MKKVILLALVLITGCQKYSAIKIDKNKAYAYQSEAFEQWEQTKKIKLEDAYKIHLEYVQTCKESFKNLNKETGFPLSYAYDNYYVFSSVTNFQKFGEFNLSGVWVNADTGEVKVVRIKPEENFETNGHYWITYYGSK